MKLASEIKWQQTRFELPLRRVQRLDELGFDAIFTAEAHGSDALTPLAYIAGLTKRIGLGTAIAQIAARSPTALAMAYQTIDVLGGGDRVIAGLGNGTPNSVEGWHGRRTGSPYWTMRDYVAIMRQTFERRGPVRHRGREISVPYGDAESSAAREPLMETNPRLPIVLGTGTETMIRLTAQIADGWIPLGFAPGMMRVYGPWLEEGFRRAGGSKGFDDFEIWVHLDVEVSDDVRAAMKPFKAFAARYVGSWASVGNQTNIFKNQMIWRGYADVADRIEELYQAGRQEEAEQAVPDEYIDEGWLVGPLERIEKRLKAWLDSGATGLIVRTENDEVFERFARVVGKG